ncbi:hypothetical protein ACNFCJ_14725 [Pseudomonas sp. NY15364]|uniref:hypothetical protein n=1 Tax=Pseudomonas sp. NY15364 TaxID=3400353 RepID=UPI003A89C7C8
MYERDILKARAWFRVYALLAVITPVAVYLYCVAFDQPSVWISRFGAVMAGFAYLAERNATAMADVLKPSGMVDITFHQTRLTYMGEIKCSIRFAILLALVGAGIWGFGDLIPIG